MKIDPIRLEIFRHLFAAAAEEMGAVLGRTGFSPNIKERKDYSCAIFDSNGELLAQAAHIPVHLGSMPLSVKAALREIDRVRPGDLIILNDPYRGGTHLPDITAVRPVFLENRIMFFTANRAHHADIGGAAPGSMPLSTSLFEEGLIIPPVKLIEEGKWNRGVWNILTANVRTPGEREGDMRAQVNACEVGATRLADMAERYGTETLNTYGNALLDYAERLMRRRIAEIPDGRYTFADRLDDDGAGNEDLPITVTLTIRGEQASVDFSGSSNQTEGNVNAVYAVTLSAVHYCFRLLLGSDIPTNGGLFRPIAVTAPEGSIVNARFPGAVVGGNVETSQRIVDALLGALAGALPQVIPAASAGTMNNLTFGGNLEGRPFTYYETIAGGAGASPSAPGADGTQTHMTNTLNTPVEALEREFPVRVEEYRLRRDSGGMGFRRGGEGIIRTLRFLTDAQVGMLSDRRRTLPYGLQGGGSGAPGRNTLLDDEPSGSPLPGKFQRKFRAGQALRIETPGGGGWGTEEP